MLRQIKQDRIIVVDFVLFTYARLHSYLNTYLAPLIKVQPSPSPTKQSWLQQTLEIFAPLKTEVPQHVVH